MDNNFRYEIKFVLNEMSLSKFLSWAYLNTSLRITYPERKVNSLYFDDTNYSSVRDNLAGITDRLKTRLRWYGVAEGQKIGIPLLEQKIKNGRMGKKISIPIYNLEETLLGYNFASMIDNIKEELPSNHLASKEYLIPALYVSYLRQYYEDSNGLRVTIDNNIKFKGQLTLNESLEDLEQVSYKGVIVEFKFEPPIKNYVAELIRSLNLTPVRNSKYLTGLAMYSQAVYF
jgi:hypothetical protein